MKPKACLLLAVLFILGSSLSVPAVSADHEATNFTRLSIDNDGFYNWDFQDTSALEEDNVDWPVTMIFYNDADRNTIKDMFYGAATVASPMYGRLKDGMYYQWDSDEGTKDPDCPIGSTANHMRLYATGGQMYTVGWGYYVIATTHQDRNECGLYGAVWSGRSEDAEEHFADYADDFYSDCGVYVFEDWSNFYNQEDYEYISSEDRDHIMDNDGYATAIYIPDDFDPDSSSCD